MPVLIPLSTILGVTFAVAADTDVTERGVRWREAACLVGAVVTTVTGNVPIKAHAGCHMISTERRGARSASLKEWGRVNEVVGFTCRLWVLGPVCERALSAGRGQGWP
jgi:hypothetical protein